LELRKKVLEEASGIINAKNKVELTSEIADTLDVINELQRTNKIKSSQIKQAQKTSRIKKGGFKKKLFLIWSSQDDYKSNETKLK
jgi:predicted house-cleaning noncanonical NTP pyrophosphatase (MazG superfamily)